MEIKIAKIKLKEKTIFQVGDIVEWHGAKGEVVREVRCRDAYFPLMVIFDDPDFGINDEFSFSRHGKFQRFHKEPALRLIRRHIKSVEFEDWEDGKKYKPEGGKCPFIKLSGLPFRLDAHAFSSNPVKYFIDNKFYEVE